MEKKINLVESLQRLGDIQRQISSLHTESEKIKKDIEAIAGNFFSPLRELIAAALMENMSKDALKKISEQEEKELRRKAHGIVVFESNTIFNPRKDSFVIESVRFNEEHTKVKISVECVKNREYLGISGCWIPETYETIWLDPKELVADVVIKEKKETTFIS